MIKMTRRDFFKTSAMATTTLVVMTSPLAAAFPDCPRQAAFRMKDRLIKDWNYGKEEVGNNFYSTWQQFPGGKQWMDDLAVFLEHLHDNITGPNKTFDEIRDEISIILKGVSRDGSTAEIDIMNCTAEAFTLCLVRDCLKNHQIPMIISRNWKQFAKKYTKYVMSA